MATKRPPGQVRDAIIAFMEKHPKGSTIAEIIEGVEEQIGPVPASSVRSYLQLNHPHIFDRLAPGRYRLRKKKL